jgi:hypothetical protein
MTQYKFEKSEENTEPNLNQLFLNKVNTYLQLLTNQYQTALTRDSIESKIKQINSNLDQTKNQPCIKNSTHIQNQQNLIQLSNITDSDIISNIQTAQNLFEITRIYLCTNCEKPSCDIGKIQLEEYLAKNLIK